MNNIIPPPLKKGKVFQQPYYGKKLDKLVYLC